MYLLPNNVVHVWFVDFRTVPDDQLESYHQSLSDEEQERVEEFSDPEQRRKQLITRMAVRSCLSKYTDSIAPKDWEFERGPKGKPALTGDSVLPLSFNLSHSEDWLAIATTVDTPVGIDLQHRNHQQSLTELAERFFHPEEAKELAELEGSWQAEQFFRFWTLKEAYLKARGLGIATGLKKAHFHLDNNGLITAEFDPELHDSGANWQFHHFRLADDYSLSIALQQPRAQDASPQFYKFIPGGLVAPLALLGHEIQVE